MNDNTLRTPKEWMEITKIFILDPDGWRSDGKSMNEPIPFEEWKWRQAMSTCMFHNTPDFYRDF